MDDERGRSGQVNFARMIHRQWTKMERRANLNMAQMIRVVNFLLSGQKLQISRENNNRRRSRSGLVVKSRPGLKPDSTEEPLCKLVHVKSIGAKCPPVGVAWKFGEGVPAQVSSSSSDCGSNLRGPSQNSSRVASKRDFNVTKLNNRRTRYGLQT
ncbi:hypothetical protein AVEN_139314-1 [Araneus ventricosus]|uniref:Uncharacterized protein n=1 Tax=Araneus ventricosus TaxID=182803 RepID=A0A4Y2QT69_ARAVE|nr:hypothetical protein AVEN_139314-1 [Araneus ventricosus]